MRKLCTLFLTIVSILIISPDNMNAQGRTGLKKMERWINRENGKEVVIIPMTHIETVEYYEEIKQKLNELKEEGFVVFFEGVIKFPPRLLSVLDSLRNIYPDVQALNQVRDHYPFAIQDSMKMDTVARKFRRVLGVHITNYTDKENKSLPKKYKKSKYVDQTAERLGLNSDKDIWVDIPLVELIEGYEEKEEITLTDCDFSTPLMEEYKCTDERGNYWYMLHGMRNEFILDKLKESPHDKIVLLYGKTHMKWFKLDLEQLMGYEKAGKK